MVLFSIPDIRLFWSTDPRFLSQFKQGQITTFKPYSKYPECYKDMSFWLPPTAKAAEEKGSAAGGKGRVWHENDFCELVREVAGDLVESVRLVSVTCCWCSDCLLAYGRADSQIGGINHGHVEKRYGSFSRQ